MCGIVGYIDIEKLSYLLLKAFKRLEYRGYDSAE
jgi:glucosamine 6-phosphate synthetase-like amidotransferase/phosphosugar isomerase protein